jgi:sporulation protein YlmC with PRC-barrel domain
MIAITEARVNPMVSLSDLRKMEVISADGKMIGLVEDATITDKWNVTGFTVNLDKDVAKSLGKKTPLFSGLRLEIAVDQVKSIGDKIVLTKPVAELGEHLKKHEGVYHVSTFMKMQVVGTGGKVLGQVLDIQLEPSQWKMPSLAVSVTREVMDHMKMKKPFMGKGQLTLSMVHVNSIKDFIMLNTDHEGLARLIESSPVK